YAFQCFPDKSNSGLDPYKVPRISEEDFENIIVSLGGVKIPVSESKTPDFLLNGVALELKDLQKESLKNKDRQVSIGEVFAKVPGYTINLDPTGDYGAATARYRRLITNTLKTSIKKASEQVKAFKANTVLNSAGIIFLNTGMYSLPHEMFKDIVTD